MNTELDQLSANLKECLNSDKPDFQKILNLANKIAAFDTDNVRFTIDASHITKLGLELVAKQETAISELVKNAYDADSTFIKLVFKDTDQSGGTLEITDNGSGMTRTELADGFMRISTSDKIDNPYSKKYSRQRAGKKGIGRFSAQRLGRELTIKTQTADSEHALQVTINWDSFEENKDLILVNNQIKLIDKLPFQGTILTIDKLRDSWSIAQIKRAYRYVSDLLQPFPLSKSEHVDKMDPGFKATFYKTVNGLPQLVANDDKSILSHSLATFSGFVDAQGGAYRTCISSRYKVKIENEELIDKNNLRVRYQHLKSIEFKANYFIVSELPSGGTKSLISGLLREQGGIRVYRNGFRVLPYGEPYDDWIGLQRSYALREILPPHLNANFFGFVEIHDPKNEMFNETSSREGLIENEAFKELQRFLYSALTKSVLDIAEARGRKRLASDPPPKSQASQNKPSEQAKQIIDLFNQVVDETKSDSDQSLTGSADNAASAGNDEVIKSEFLEKVLALDHKSQDLLEENGMLRVLAALGLTIGEFTHEIRHTLSGSFADFKNLYESFNLDSNQSDIVKRLQSNLVNLQAYANYFDNAVIDNSHRELKVIELRDVINNFEQTISHAINRQNIVFNKEVNGYDLYTQPMHESEWNSILLNLFTNSLKAIRRAKVNGKILIKAGESGEKLFLEFMDNGDGISVENRERIFDAFYTTSLPASSLSPDSEQLIGTGLGLKIVKDIIDAADGEIYLTDPPEDYKTCFRIEIPKAKQEDIPKDDY